MTRDPQLAMDVTQWTFLKALETGFEVRTRPEALSWLYRTATQRCLHLLRAHSTHERLHTEHRDALLGMPRPSPESTAADRELVHRALAMVDDRTGEIALLTWAQGMSNERAADLCGVSVRTVGRARSTFENCLRTLVEEAS
jgi:RNA polymerase sigma factor (sigma-70 family)